MKIKKMRVAKSGLILVFFMGLTLVSCGKHCYEPHEKHHECGNHSGPTSLTSTPNTSSFSEVIPSIK